MKMLRVLRTTTENLQCAVVEVCPRALRMCGQTLAVLLAHVVLTQVVPSHNVVEAQVSASLLATSLDLRQVWEHVSKGVLRSHLVQG
jgi:hypothetical protein